MRVDARQWTSALKILLGTAAGRKKRQSARPQNQRERSNLFLFLGITAGRRAGERGHGSACNERAKQTSAIGLIWHRDSLVMCGALLYYICLQLWGIKSFSKKHALFWRFFLFSFLSWFWMRMLATFSSLRKPFERQGYNFVTYNGYCLLGGVGSNRFGVFENWVFWVNKN